MSSRQKDLAHLEEQVLALGSEARGVQEKFQKYNTKVGQRIRQILEKAGVWEEVNALEAERNETSRKAQEKLRDLDTRMKDLQRVRAFLLGREQEDPGVEAKSKEEEPTVEETWGEEADEGVGDKDEDLIAPEF
jgi:chromosome segregation ATPase